MSTILTNIHLSTIVEFMNWNLTDDDVVFAIHQKDEESFTLHVLATPEYREHISESTMDEIPFIDRIDAQDLAEDYRLAMLASTGKITGNLRWQTLQNQNGKDEYWHLAKLTFQDETLTKCQQTDAIVSYVASVIRCVETLDSDADTTDRLTSHAACTILDVVFCEHEFTSRILNDGFGHGTYPQIHCRHCGIAKTL